MADSPALSNKEMRSTLSRQTNVFKTPKRANYTIIPNEVVRDKALSIEARGTIALVLSLPSDWEFHREWLEKESGCGREKMTRILDELQSAGYLRRNLSRNAKGRATANYQFFSVALKISDREAPPVRENRNGSTAMVFPPPTKEREQSKDEQIAPNTNGVGSIQNPGASNHPQPPPSEAAGRGNGGGPPALVPDPATCRSVVTSIEKEIQRLTLDGKDLPTEVKRTAKAIAVRKDWQVEPARKAIVSAWEMLPICTVANLRMRLGL